MNFQLKHKCTGISLQSCEISRWLILQDVKNTEWRRKTENKCLIGQTLTKRREKEKEMVVLSKIGKKISIKTEVASSAMKPFEKQPVEHEEEASERKYEVIGMDIEMEYEEMDTEEEESKVRKLTKEELEVYQQYKVFYTIQGRTKGKIPGFSYIHRLKVKECYPGVPSDVAEMLSHPIEGVSPGHRSYYRTRGHWNWMKTCYGAMKDELILDQKERQSYCVSIQILIPM